MKPRRRDLHNARDPYCSRTQGDPIPIGREAERDAEAQSRDHLAALYRYGMKHGGLPGQLTPERCRYGLWRLGLLQEGWR